MFSPENAEKPIESYVNFCYVGGDGLLPDGWGLLRGGGPLSSKILCPRCLELEKSRIE
jgi:hypothetical protein